MSDTWEWNVADAIEEIAAGLFLIDLGFQGRKEVVAAYLLVSDDELVLIETGPGSTIDNLRKAMRRIGFTFQDLTRVLVTHIHLDHAGAAGLLARENPALTVHVHPFGAPHLIDPTKLINSATRIYGDQMGPLWGEFAPIPEHQVIAFEDEEVMQVAGRDLQVFFTPGHAWHHVAFWDPARAHSSPAMSVGCACRTTPTFARRPRRPISIPAPGRTAWRAWKR